MIHVSGPAGDGLGDDLEEDPNGLLLKALRFIFGVPYTTSLLNPRGLPKDPGTVPARRPNVPVGILSALALTLSSSKNESFFE